MTVLVTGGAGYIGAHTAHALVDRGEDVMVVDDLSTGVRDAVPSGARLLLGDVAEGELLRRALAGGRVDAIVHFAARTVVPDSVADPLGYYFANTVKTQALFTAAVQAGVQHIVFSSTAAVYGEPDLVPVAEDAPPRPASPYGASKAMSERILTDAAAAHGFGFAILRYFNVAGADPAGRVGQSTPRATHLIKVACEVALGRRDRLTIYGDDFPTADGTGIRDYIHVSDLAAAHLLALDHLRAGGASFTANCGYGRGFSVREVVRAVERAAGHRLAVTVAPRRPGDLATVVADPARLRALLPWRPSLDDLDLIVAHALAWERRLQTLAAPGEPG